MIDPARVALFHPPSIGQFKTRLFNRVGEKIKRAGGRVVFENYDELRSLPADFIPVVGASPNIYPIVQEWRASGRTWIGWDRGYVRRPFATALPRATCIEASYYRWTINAYQMRSIRNVPDDRWKALNIRPEPWKSGGRHIVIAAPTKTYLSSHDAGSWWITETIAILARVTDRQIVIRDKESKRSLQSDLHGAHALVTHGSIAAVEAVILGCPVFVHPDSAATPVGRTDLTKIESPIYPDRQPWLNSLAYSQWTEDEFTDGTLYEQIA